MDPIADAIATIDRTRRYLDAVSLVPGLCDELECARDRLEAYHLELVLRGVCPAEVPAPTPQETRP